MRQKGKRAWYGTFPSIRCANWFIVANATFFLVSYFWGQQALVEWAWRIPFISSLALVLVGLYVRLTLHESHVFIEAEEKGKLKAPVSVVFTKHFKPMVIGTFIMVATYSFILYYDGLCNKRILVTTVNPFRSGLSNGVRHSCQYLHGITFNKRDCFCDFYQYFQVFMQIKLVAVNG